MSAQGMPPQILALFAPRLPLEYLPPICSTGIKPCYTGIHEYTHNFKFEEPTPLPVFETPKERRERKKKEKLAEYQKKLNEVIATYDPHSNDCATKNPYATLFVGRLSYETTEKKLKKEFEVFGPIKRIKVMTDFNGKSRGYAFIEYEVEEDLKTAYKQGDGKKIDGRRVLVDVERSRTVPGWIPRRLGGGKGPGRFVEPKKKKTLMATQSIAPPISLYASRSSWQTSSYRSNNRSSGIRRDDYRFGGYSSNNRSRPANNERSYRDSRHESSHRAHGTNNYSSRLSQERRDRRRSRSREKRHRSRSREAR